MTALVFSDENTVNLEARILESFDGDSNYDWRLVASKFASKIGEDTFPKLIFAETWPQALYGTNRAGKELKSLGVWGKFDRRGYNWIDIYPVEKDGDDTPAEIPIPGRAQYLDMWVWSASFNYYIEAYIRDYQGVVHSLNLGNIGHQGWKNLRTWIPSNIRQGKRALQDPSRPTVQTAQGNATYLKFVKFRVWTQPVEQVGNFYIYFDQFKVLTDTFESLFDGDELADPEHIQELWGGAVSTSN
jgi:hypothetical protein